MIALPEGFSPADLFAIFYQFAAGVVPLIMIPVTLAIVLALIRNRGPKS